VGEDRNQKKQSTEQVLALGDPGHALDPLRMHGEEGRDQEALGPPGREPPCEPEHEHDVDRVQHDVREMMPARPLAEDAHVEHV